MFPAIFYKYIIRQYFTLQFTEIFCLPPRSSDLLMNIHEFVLACEIKYFRMMQIIVLQGYLLYIKIASNIFSPKVQKIKKT